jgi:molybdate transport system permease protein
MTPEDWHLVGFTLGMAALSTAVLIPPGLWLAWLLARRNWPGKTWVETVVALPLILPPVATGLILLKLFSRRSWLGAFLWETFGLSVVFTWRGVVVALALMSLPLFVRSARVAFAGVNRRHEQIAASLGATPTRVFWTVSVPLARRGLLAGVLLAFARALGEFGATVVLAGNIPDRTQTLALAIYQSVQMGDDDHAFRLLMISLILAFVLAGTSEWLSRRPDTRP